MNIMHNKMVVKFMTQLCHAPQWRTTQHSKVSKYQLISQTKLDKGQLWCYSKCQKWHPLASTQQCRHLCHWSTVSSIIVAETHESIVATRQHASGAYRLKKVREKDKKNIMPLHWHRLIMQVIRHKTW